MFLDTEFLKNEEIQLVLEKTVDGDEKRNWVPAYHFFICNLDGIKMGACDLRIGYNDNLYYGGHIGYHVFPEYCGNHYAGGKLLEIVTLPEGNDMRDAGEYEKCIYQFDLKDE